MLCLATTKTFEISVISLGNIDSREVHYKHMCGTVMASLVLSFSSNALVGQKLTIIC